MCTEAVIVYRDCHSVWRLSQGTRAVTSNRDCHSVHLISQGTETLTEYRGCHRVLQGISQCIDDATVYRDSHRLQGCHIVEELSQ